MANKQLFLASYDIQKQTHHSKIIFPTQIICSLVILRHQTILGSHDVENS